MQNIIPPPGKLIVFAAPSGAGKTTIVKHLLTVFPILRFSVSATTRSIRPNETHGKDYYFLSHHEFKEKIHEGAFLEWQEVYGGHYYGTLKSEVDTILASGFVVIFDVDVVGALNIKKRYDSKALTVFVKVNSVDTLRQRLLQRYATPPPNFEERVAKAAHELQFESKFDVSILNEDLIAAKQAAEMIVRNFLSPENTKCCK
ncbi:MAG: guanylate kinase [Bacteroidetes bacterium]|nr:guanylate kinase [Bacteroidota bacterium]HMS52407.1 guanylate kinase [Chitinophagales bacterium]